MRRFACLSYIAHGETDTYRQDAAELNAKVAPIYGSGHRRLIRTDLSCSKLELHRVLAIQIYGANVA